MIRAVVTCVALLAPLLTAAQTVHATLEGTQEVPANLSEAEGSFVAKIDARARTIAYVLEYDALEGAVTQAHVHVGQPGVNGGVVVWLCQTGQAAAPAGTPACPSPGGAVEGNLEVASVVGPGVEPQLLATPGTDEAFDRLVRAIQEGVAYANVHSSVAPAGEIRGQIK